MSSPRLLEELLDQVVDQLHGTEDALRNCGLVSKSWIPRTRRHLFAEIQFDTEQKLELWKETFPDPSTSPANYTKSLVIQCLYSVTAADAEAGGWITGFSHIVHLKLGCYDEWGASLLPFRGISPVLKSLHVEYYALPSLPTFELILSFPRLQDLTVINSFFALADNRNGSAVQPSNPPTFTGSLELLMMAGMERIARRLLSVPSGINFRKLDVLWICKEDILLTSALAEKCSHTLETLEITCNPDGMPTQHLRPHR